MKRAAAALFLIVALARSGESKVNEWVRQLDNPDQKERYGALQALIDHGPKSIPACLKAFRDKKQPAMRRWHAAMVLGGLKARKAVPHLLAGVKDRDWRVAAVSADQLGNIGDKSVLRKLQKLRGAARHPQIQKALDSSIAKLGGPPPKAPKVPKKPDVLEPVGFAWIPWAKTIEEARARARQERKKVLAFVTPWNSKQMESGYEGAGDVVNHRMPANYDPVRTRRTDPGHIKERALLTALLCNPDLAELVTKHFVPVRVHMHTWHFMSSGRGTWKDPLTRLGTSAREAHPPALIFATHDGKLLHKITNMGVFSAPLTYRTCNAVLGLKQTLTVRPGEALLRKADYAGAAKVLRAIRKPDERDRFYLAYAEHRSGRSDKAKAMWNKLAAGRGLWATRARLHLDPHGPRPREWITLRDFAEVDPMIPTTEVGRGGVKAAIDYLLDQQRPDGAWPDSNDRFSLPERFSLVLPRTAICVSALRAWRKEHPGKQIDAAIRKGIEFVRARWNKQTGVWHLTYALHLAVDLGDKKAMEQLAKQLGTIEHNGGWTYTGSNRLHTFNTAPILILLAEAQSKGAKIDAAMMRRAAAFLERNRVRGVLFHYGTTMEHMMPKGARGANSSCFRSPLCELALHRLHRGGGGAKKSTKGIKKALAVFFAGLDAARSTTKVFESYVDPSIAWQDAYRYFFGVYYAACGVRLVGDKKGAVRLKARILGHQEIDGSFVDGQMVGKTSSTGLVLLALSELR